MGFLAIDAGIVSVGAIITAIIGGVIALIKVRPEARETENRASSIIVNSAQGAVLVQSTVIEDLREQLASQSKQIDLLESKVSEMAALTTRINELEKELVSEKIIRAHVEVERGKLMLQVFELEARLAKLENGNALN